MINNRRSNVTINLSPKQLKVMELVMMMYIEILAVDRRESTYSEITENRWKTAIEIKNILQESRYK